jgi:sulfoacetaldehyde acetyltransferase
MAKMTSSEAFVETMAANDVTDIFGIMGSAFMDAMDIFEPAGIRFIPVVHEQGAAHMAVGMGADVWVLDNNPDTL